MMQTFCGHESMQFWYMSQIKLTLTGDSIYVTAKAKPRPLRPNREEKTPPVLGHGVNFVRKFEQNSVFSEIDLHQTGK